MPNHLDVDQLSELPLDQLQERVTFCRARISERVERAQSQNRDLDEAETWLTNNDRHELGALNDALALRSSNTDRGQKFSRAIGEAVEMRGAIDNGALDEFAAAVAGGRPVRVQVECRAVTTAVAGARGAVAVSALGRPEWVWQAARIPFASADGLTVTGPLYAALVAQDATPETQDKPAMADPTLASATLLPFAVTQTVSDQVIRFGVGAQAVTDRLAAESVFSVNAATVAALETAADTPLAFAGTASHSADLAIARVWAQTGSKPTALLVNSLDYPELADKAAVGPGDGIAAATVMFNGTPLIVNDAVSAGVAVAVNGSAFSAHGTDVLFASLPNLGDNTVTLRAETYFALLQHDAGAIVAVDLLGS